VRRRVFRSPQQNRGPKQEFSGLGPQRIKR
jgi:hypothetical protein